MRTRCHEASTSVNRSCYALWVTRAATLPERERGVCCDLKLEPAAKAADAVAVLKALADPTRLQMVLALRAAKEPICVCDFTAALALSQPTISHHVARLREAGLVEVTRKGVWAYYRLSPHLPEPVRRIVEALG